MDEESDWKSNFTDEEVQDMMDHLDAVNQHHLDVKHNHKDRYAAAQGAAEDIIELVRGPEPDWYAVAMCIAEFESSDYQMDLGYVCWEHWSLRNNLPTETIAKHLEIYRQLTELREIPVEKYAHLTPDRISALLEPLLPSEPKVPAISTEIECSSIMALNWWEWEQKLLSCLKA